MALYHYHLPKKSIALRPARPRDAAKLLVVDRRGGRAVVSNFQHLGQYLPSRSVLVFNDTKVLPARLSVTKPSGGKAQLLYLNHDRRTVTCLSDRRLDLGWQLRVTPSASLTVMEHRASVCTLRPSVSVKKFLILLERRGLTPLPPYLRHSPLSEADRRVMYQSIFARRGGSAAAPTASLHFTPRLMTSLRKRGIGVEFVTLHVGLGTFAPVTVGQVRSKKLHEEQYDIPSAVAQRLNAAKQQGKPIIAVGTTVARTLESATKQGRLLAGRGATSIFIQPGCRWRFVDGLITNFHVPRSSLMMLVASMIGRERLLRLYRLALRKGFRFFSFGDGMLIRP